MCRGLVSCVLVECSSRSTPCQGICALESSGAFSTSGTARSFSNTSIRRLPLKQQLLLKQDSSKQSFGCIGHILVASKIDPKSFKNCPITQEQTKVCRMQRIYWVVRLFTSAAALEGSMRGPNSEGEITHERSKYTTTTEHSEGIQEIA